MYTEERNGKRLNNIKAKSYTKELYLGILKD